MFAPDLVRLGRRSYWSTDGKHVQALLEQRGAGPCRVEHGSVAGKRHIPPSCLSPDHLEPAGDSFELLICRQSRPSSCVDGSCGAGASCSHGGGPDQRGSRKCRQLHLCSSIENPHTLSDDRKEGKGKGRKKKDRQTENRGRAKNPAGFEMPPSLHPSQLLMNATCCCSACCVRYSVHMCVPMICARPCIPRPPLLSSTPKIHHCQVGTQYRTAAHRRWLRLYTQSSSISDSATCRSSPTETTIPGPLPGRRFSGLRPADPANQK